MGENSHLPDKTVKFIMQHMMTRTFTGFGFEFNFAFRNRAR